MRIVFNLHSVGLGNNGGSRTLIRCAETLQALGVEVYMYADRNKYTWHKTNVPIVAKAPRCDVMIATGYRSVPSTVKARASRKYYYIRGFELWQASEAKLLASYRSLNCIVNSEWLQRYLSKNGVTSKIVYPGLDFEWFQKINQEPRKRIGGLFHAKHATKRYQDVAIIAKALGQELFLVNKHIKNCSNQAMAELYNSIRVWIAPTELEGLHNPPMESSLCGCGLVCTDHPRSGMSDYAIHKKTALVYPSRNIKKATEYTKRFLDDDELLGSLNQNMVELLRQKIGTRKENMTKLLKVVST